MTSKTNPRGHTWTATYNALDQLITVQGPQPMAPMVSYLYDDRENVYQINIENKDASGNVVSANSSFTATYTHDDRELLIGVDLEIEQSGKGPVRHLHHLALGLVRDHEDAVRGCLARP